MASERRIPPLSWLLAFESAARHKSFGSAAGALGTSQPAISQRIAHLEASLGVALFRRLPRVVTSQTEFDIKREPIDVAVVFGSGRWPGCSAEPLVREAVLPVCAPSLLDRHSRPAGPSDLQALPLLHLESGEATEWLDWPGWFAAQGVSVAAGEHRITINNYSLVIQA